ncbi:MAG: TatD family hydrolase [Cryomorphaceae bacterium]|nr:TatD family hydrolase [Flavobacteriales bacterium]
MKIIDTHSHMYAEEFDEDREACMERAIERGVVLTALPNIDRSSVEPLKKLLDDFPDQTIGMMGLHPTSVKDDFRSELEMLRAELEKRKYFAVGEIGMDLYWDKTFKAEQEEAFKIQIGWAKEMELPIAIHARDSLPEIFKILDIEGTTGLSGVFHCFSGSEAEAEKALTYPNFYLGLGGVLTFKNGGLDKVMAKFGLDRLVVETDAPYLTPAPFRGKRNETAYTRLVVEKLAEIHGLPAEDVAAVTTANAVKLFQLDGI